MSLSNAPQAFVNIDNFEADRVRFALPKVNKHGGKYVRVTYKAEDGVEKEMALVMPWMRTPFGISRFEKKDERGVFDYQLSLSVDTERPGGDKALKMLSDLYDRMVETMEKHSKEWVGKVLKPGQAEVLCKEIARPSIGKDGTEYQPNFNAKILVNRKTNRFDVEVYRDMKQPPVDLDDTNFSTVVGQGSLVRGIFVCRGIWLIDGKASMTFCASQIQVRPNATRVPSGIIRNVLPDDEDEDVAADLDADAADAVSESSSADETPQTSAARPKDDETTDDEESDTEAAAPVKKEAPARATGGRKRKAESHADAPAGKR